MSHEPLIEPSPKRCVTKVSSNQRTDGFDRSVMRYQRAALSCSAPRHSIDLRHEHEHLQPGIRESERVWRCTLCYKTVPPFERRRVIVSVLFSSKSWIPPTSSCARRHLSLAVSLGIVGTLGIGGTLGIAGKLGVEEEQGEHA